MMNPDYFDGIFKIYGYTEKAFSDAADQVTFQYFRPKTPGCKPTMYEKYPHFTYLDTPVRVTIKRLPDKLPYQDPRWSCSVYSCTSDKILLDKEYQTTEVELLRTIKRHLESLLETYNVLEKALESMEKSLWSLEDVAIRSNIYIPK